MHLLYLPGTHGTIISIDRILEPVRNTKTLSHLGIGRYKHVSKMGEQSPNRACSPEYMARTLNAEKKLQSVHQRITDTWEERLTPIIQQQIKAGTGCALHQTWKQIVLHQDACCSLISVWISRTFGVPLISDEWCRPEVSKNRVLCVFLDSPNFEEVKLPF